MNRRLAVQTLGVLLLAIVAGPTRADGIRVSIEKLAFTPPQVSAHVGDTIQWVNADFVTHTATARNGDWDVMIPADPPRILVLTAGGMVDYYCKFHPNMTGRISVAK